MFRVILAISVGALEIGRVNAYAPEFSSAKVAAAGIFRLLDRTPSISDDETIGKTKVVYFHLVKKANFFQF